MSSKSFHLISLGCSKNTVDSDSMTQLLQKAGYQSTDNPKWAEFVIVNTCGFIRPAKEEALQVLKQLVRQKRNGQKLIAAGCLTQRDGTTLLQQVPGVDGILGTRRWMDILDVIQNLRGMNHPTTLYHLPDSTLDEKDEQGVLRAAVQGASAYLKIADGCRRPCAFCAIPLIKGANVSRPVVAILEDARQLQTLGVRELILIAQDTTDYGSDIGMKDGLAHLLEKLTATLIASPPGARDDSRIQWVRIMYAYPGAITERLIEVMARHTQIVHYLDIPMQHAHPTILRSMRRPANTNKVMGSIEKMRAAMPDLAIRTTFIVGYPGEGETEFQTLLDFVRAMRFDHVGAFPYYYEPGTPAEILGDPVPPEVKQERYNRLMEVQQSISLEKNQFLIGKKMEVLVEGHRKGLSIGRSYRDAPEIDGLIFIEGKLPAGVIVPVYINGAMTYDLSAVPAR